MDLAVFDGVAEAESYLEAIDVRNGAHVAYDADGRRLALNIRATHEGKGFFRVTIERVAIACAEEVPSGQGALREILTTYLGEVGVPAAELVSATFSELQQLARRSALR